MEQYEKAARLGHREVSARTARGEDGYLPALDVQMEQCGVLAYVNLPTRELMLEEIVGTYTTSRSRSFSHSFLPLHPLDSEFAAKWVRLCEAHETEGLREPIKVYEYLWKYYVVEGNKRVSVLRFYGAASYAAEITRLIPQRGEDTETYYAYLAYEKRGLIPGIQLSRPERYRKLAKLEREYLEGAGRDREPNEPAALYMRFRKLYTEDAKLCVGDAFVQYLRIYGFDDPNTDAEFSERLAAMRPQLMLLSGETEPNLVMDSEIEPTGFFAQLRSNLRRPRILFAYGPGREPGNWLGAHERGRLAMQAEFGDRVSSDCIDGIREDNAYELFCERASDANLLFVTSAVVMAPALRFTLEHPSCLTLVYSRLRCDYRLNTYFGRYYEAVFLCGVAAGLATANRKVAYITPRLPYKRFTSDINAFAQGVRSVSPAASVLLVTRDVRPHDAASVRAAMAEVAKRGADVALAPLYGGISLPDMPENAFSVLLGLDEQGEPLRYLASPGWNWDKFYTTIVRSYLAGGLDALREANATSFWWGLGDDVIDFHTSDWAPPVTANLMRYLKGCIRRGLYDPFHGPLTDQDGAERVAAHSNPRPLEIITMDYLADYIEVVE